jgi:outer membrane protein
MTSGGWIAPAWAAALVLLAFAVAPTGAAEGWLATVRDDALALDPALAGAQAQLHAAQERVFQARASYGPTASASLENNQARYTEGDALRMFHGTVSQLQITQPLLRTDLLPALNSAQAQLEQSRATLGQLRAEATVHLLEALFDTLKARDTTTLVQAQRLAAEEQLALARRSFQVGNVSVIDVREAEARIDTVDAQALAAAADLQLKQQFVAELVGRPLPELLERSVAGDRLPELAPSGLVDWLADASTRNLQLQAARRALDAAEAELDKAWKAHAPTLNLTYNYTNNADSGTVTSVFARHGESSTIGVSLNVPLFASGATQSKVREAMALRDKAQSDVDAARRSVQLGVRQSFSAALGSVAVAHGLETATRSLEVALHANRRGYEVGMKIGAEVLEAQSKVFESRRDMLRARYDAWLNYLKLTSFAGTLDEAGIAEIDRLLVATPPAQPLPRARGANAGHP